MKGSIMEHFDQTTRPRLLDLATTRQAIAQTGIKLSDRAKITASLMDHYVVDLDILATALGQLRPGGETRSHLPDLSRAA